MDSKSKISQDLVLAKAAGSASGKHKEEQIRDKKITFDPSFEKIKKEILLKAQIAKFEQNPELLDLLLKTKNAKLVHYVRGSPPIVFSDLMQIRKRRS